MNEFLQSRIIDVQGQRPNTEAVCLSDQIDKLSDSSLEENGCLLNGEVADGNSPSYRTSEQERAANLACYIQKLLLIQGSAEGYARWITLKEIRGTHVEDNPSYKQRKKDAKLALLALDDIDKLSILEKEDALKRFRNYWGETSEYFESAYRKIQTTLTEEPLQDNRNGSAQSMPNARRIFTDSDISYKRKVELLEMAGYSKKDAIKAVGKITFSIGITVVSSGAAEYGAILAAGYATTSPFIEGLTVPKDMPTLLQDLKSLGIDAAAFAGFYGATWLYAIQNNRLLKKTGLGLNAAASIPYHINKALLVPEKQRDKEAIRSVFGYTLAGDLPYLSTIAVPVVGPSMMAAAYIYGIGFTLGQSAICEGAIRIAQANERFHIVQKVTTAIEKTQVPQKLKKLKKTTGEIYNVLANKRFIRKEVN